MNKQTKSFLYNLVAFGILFFPIRYMLLENFMHQGIMKSLIAFAIATLIAPKFQAVRTNEGEKIYIKWIFSKGVKEVK